MLGFQAGDRLPSVVLCTGQHQGPANTEAGSADKPDYDTQTWVTVAAGAQEQERHRVQMFYDFNKIWGKRVLVWINRVYHPGRKMQSI